jgi:hypothetical protein
MSKIRPLSKSDLCEIFGMVSAGGHNYYGKLRKLIFTDKVLSELNISKDRYNRVRTFTYLESKRIIEFFQIEKHEMES